MGGTGGGGPTMCHNILLPSKGSNEWRNIPFRVNFSDKNFSEKIFGKKLLKVKNFVRLFCLNLGIRLIHSFPSFMKILETVL